MVGRYELAPAPEKQYAAGCDATGFSSGPGADAFTLSVGHYELDIFIQDCCRGWKKSRTSNINLEAIVKEVTEILRHYGLLEVYGDRYSGNGLLKRSRKRESLPADGSGQVGFLCRAGAAIRSGQDRNPGPS